MGEATIASVPLIDISKYAAWGPEERREQAVAVRAGFNHSGFVQAVEEPAFTRRANAICMRLMMRPLEELLAYYDEADAGMRGYTPLFAETALKEGSVPDVKHFFDVPLFDAGKERRLPQDVAGDVLDLREEIKERAMTLLRLLAVSYGCSENHFVNLVAGSEHSIMRFLAYPGLASTASLLLRVLKGDESVPFPVARTARSFLLALGCDSERSNPLHAELCRLVSTVERSSEHADMCFLTALVTSTADGLYISHGGTPLPLSTQPDRLTFNAGDMAVEYTHHHYPKDPMASTRHGVKHATDLNAPRFALAAFFQFRRDVRLNQRWTSGEFHDFITKQTITPV